MSRRLSVLLAAFHEPRLLLLDEPFDGVDPLGVDATLEVVRAARAGGAAVLVSTHLLHLAVEACDEAVVLRGGRVVGAAPARELSGDGGARPLPRADLVTPASRRAAAARCSALRWQMLRTPGARRGAAARRRCSCWLLLVAAALSAGALDQAALATAVDLAPQAFLGFGVLAVVAPLTAGGGNEVVPPDQLVAYPVRASTQFLGGLLLAPVNLVWALQLLVLVAVTATCAAAARCCPPRLTSAAYVARSRCSARRSPGPSSGCGRPAPGAAPSRRSAAAAAGRRRRRRAGRRSAASCSTAPRPRAVVAGVAGRAARRPRCAGRRPPAPCSPLTAAGLGLGARACGWALRRPGDAGAQRRPRRSAAAPLRAAPLRQLVAVDRRSAWRAPALRRGGLVLALLPGVLAAGAAVPWGSLIVLPGLVAAGAGLLFGVNAFCLDGSGAALARLAARRPRGWSLRGQGARHRRDGARGRRRRRGVGVAAAARASRPPPSSRRWSPAASPARPSSSRPASSSSIKRPAPGGPAGPRDAVAPPGALALASVRLAVPAALVGVLFAVGRPAPAWLCRRAGRSPCPCSLLVGPVGAPQPAPLGRPAGAGPRRAGGQRGLTAC